MIRFIIAMICWLTLAAPAWADYTEGAIAYIAGNYETAMQEFRPLADQGDTNAQFMLGLMYVEGRGVPQDHAEALKWYCLAAAQGDAVAQLNLGVMFDNGRGASGLCTKFALEPPSCYRRHGDNPSGEPGYGGVGVALSANF